MHCWLKNFLYRLFVTLSCLRFGEILFGGCLRLFCDLNRLEMNVVTFHFFKWTHESLPTYCVLCIGIILTHTDQILLFTGIKALQSLRAGRLYKFLCLHLYLLDVQSLLPNSFSRGRIHQRIGCCLLTITCKSTHMLPFKIFLYVNGTVGCNRICEWYVID